MRRAHSLNHSPDLADDHDATDARSGESAARGPKSSRSRVNCSNGVAHAIVPAAPSDARPPTRPPASCAGTHLAGARRRVRGREALRRHLDDAERLADLWRGAQQREQRAAVPT